MLIEYMPLTKLKIPFSATGRVRHSHASATDRQAATSVPRSSRPPTRTLDTSSAVVLTLVVSSRLIRTNYPIQK